jgi:regulator of replication initiation timing
MSERAWSLVIEAINERDALKVENQKLRELLLESLEYLDEDVDDVPFYRALRAALGGSNE